MLVNFTKNIKWIEFSIYVILAINNRALNELQCCLEQSKDSAISRGSENLKNLPKAFSQSKGVGGIKRLVNSIDQLDFKRPKHDESHPTGRIVATITTVNINDLNNGPAVIILEIHHEEQQQRRARTNVVDQLGVSPSSNITVRRAQTSHYSLPMRAPARHSLSAHQRPIQKVRQSSKQWLEHKSVIIGKSELSTDDSFWSKHNEGEEQQQKQPQAAIHPSLTSPPSSQQQKTFTKTTILKSRKSCCSS